MATDEEVYAKQMEDAGVDVPGLKKTDENKNEKVETEEKSEDKTQKKADKETEGADDKKTVNKDDEGEDDDDKSDDQPPAKEKKRSIYDDLKDKKKESKGWQSLAVEALKAQGVDLSGSESFDELREKLQSISKAKNPEEKKEALDEFDEFAQKYEGNPEALRELRNLILKGVKPDEALQKDLQEFQQWKQDNQKSIDEANFETEFATATPALKQLFPNANESELKDIKTELKKLAHTKGWNDKELEYIAFKHKDTLSALVSPRKKGTESRENKQEDVETDSDFDPNADYSKMTPAQREKWEKQYKEASKGGEGLVKGANGKKLIL